MTRLVFQPAGEPERRIDLSRPITMGGGETDDVRFPELPDRLMVVSPTLEGVIVEARCAVQVDDRPVPAGARRLLRREERAVLEGCVVWCEGPDPEAEGTRALAGAILAGEAVPLGGPRVLVLQGPMAGRRFRVADGHVVGRSRRADIPVADPLASRRHLQLELGDGVAAARDLGSKNGVSVNRERIGRDRVPLRPGDTLEIGGTVLVYEDEAPEKPEVAATPRVAPELREAGRERRRAPRRAAVAIASGALLAIAALLAHAAL